LSTVRILEVFMNYRLNKVTIQLIAALISLLVAAIWTNAQSQKPYDKQTISQALTRIKLSTSPAAKTQAVNMLLAKIKARGVNFQVDEETELELRRAGATDNLIASVRANYRGPICRSVAAGAPYSTQELKSLLEVGTPPDCVASYVKSRGVNFTNTPAITGMLRQAGANNNLVAAVAEKSAPAPPPQPQYTQPRTVTPTPVTPTQVVPQIAIRADQQLKIRLKSSISTKFSKKGQKFAAEVVDGEYQGAEIEGHLVQVERSGRIKGRPEIALEFDTIRHNGKSALLRAMIIRIPNAEKSKDMELDAKEGSIRGKERGSQTGVAAIGGAGLGAIIGGVLGGKKGAVRGAAGGAGAGTGASAVRGPNDLELGEGMELIIKTLTEIKSR
jgi:hypothetical protein